MSVTFYFQKLLGVPIDIETSLNVKITSVRGLTAGQPKELFTRDWANEDGIDVYMPNLRKIQSQDVVMTFFAKATQTKSAIDIFDEFREYIIDGEIDYWDTLQKRKVRLIFKGDNLMWYQFIGTQKLMFECTFINKSGTIEAII
jgi:hypothetical protein